jgi:hypothetical protein
MTINDWFDVYNAAHVSAYEHLQTTGVWPEGFIPEGTEFENGWISILHMQFTDAWVRHVKDIANGI